MLSVQDFLSFEKLLTPLIIKFVYFIGLVLIPLGGVIFAVGALLSGSIGSFLGILIGTALYLIFWRMLIEAWIVFFGIFDRLGEIRDASKR